MKYYIWTAWYFYLDWKWIFYPKDLSSSKFLDFYSKKFNFLEINSSFYRFPWKNYKIYEKYDLCYSVKAHKSFTHFRKINEELVSKFFENLASLKNSWKLKVILFQFPFSFKFTADNFEYLQKIITYFEKLEIYLSFEFRHNSWFSNEAISYLEKLVSEKINIVHTHWKFYNQLIIWPWINLWGKFDYYRFHWIGDKKYFYNYSDDELKQLAEKIKSISKNKKEVFVAFNNTVKANAIFNAEKLKTLLFLN